MLNIITPLHKKSKRDYVARMIDEKIECSRIARKYDQEYWDGDRRYGYGGYLYDGRWSEVAQALINQYDLKDDARILDVGCGKGFLLYEFKKLLPKAEVVGIEISPYAIDHAKEEVKDCIMKHRAQDPYPFGDNVFDFVYTNTTLHNLFVNELKTAVQEIERVGKNKFIIVESFRNVEELFNVQCWALTCNSFYTPDEWMWLYKEFGYTGDYEFIYFE